MLLDKIEQQWMAHEQELDALKEGRKEGMEDLSKELPKPTLQKLTPTDNVEHFLATSERIVAQQKWLKGVWAMQVAGLLTSKVMVAYAALIPEDAVIWDGEGSNTKEVRD